MQYFLLGFLLLFAACETLDSNLSEPPTTLMKKENVIIIETSETVEEYYDQINGLLKKKGFSLKKGHQIECLSMEQDIG